MYFFYLYTSGAACFWIIIIILLLYYNSINVEFTDNQQKWKDKHKRHEEKGAGSMQK